MKYFVTIDDQIYEVEIPNLHARPIVAMVNGERFEVEPQNGQGYSSQAATPPTPQTSAAPVQAQSVPAAPTGVAPSGGVTVRAPIPGVIVALLVHIGDEVIYGQELCTIEAMKMRNNIRASHPGKIAEILVDTGQTVNHNDPLMRFEEQA